MGILDSVIEMVWFGLIVEIRLILIFCDNKVRIVDNGVLCICRLINLFVVVIFICFDFVRGIKWVLFICWFKFWVFVFGILREFCNCGDIGVDWLRKVCCEFLVFF